MKNKLPISRRQFLRQSSIGMATAASLPIISGCTNLFDEQPTKTVSNEQEINPGNGNDHGPFPPKAGDLKKNLLGQRQLGKTELQVSLLAFGGGSQFMLNNDDEWEQLLYYAV